MHRPYVNFSKQHPLLNKLLHVLGTIIAAAIVIGILVLFVLSRLIGRPSFWS